MTFDPKSAEVTCVTLPKDHCVQVPWKYIKVCEYSDPFFKNLNQRSLTPRWPLTLHLLRSHVWLYPRIIVSKSHGNTSMYVDTVINFAKYHIHTTYRMSDHVVSFWTQLRQDKNINSSWLQEINQLLTFRSHWIFWTNIKTLEETQWCSCKYHSSAYYTPDCLRRDVTRE